jgi:methyl-accepting chemotaxis protein
VGNLMRRAADDLAADGRRLESSARARLTAVVEEVIAASDLDVRIAAVLDHELTERTLERVLASPGLERLLVQVLDSRFLDVLTERVLQTPEMDRVVEHIASSPQVLDAISAQTQSLTQEMVADVRRATHTADDVAERAVRGWLRRPRPATP